VRRGAPWLAPLLAVFVFLFTPAIASAAPIRILIAVGASAGLSNEPRLSHPKADATGVRDVFVSLGWVRPDHAFFLPDASRAALNAAFDRAQALARERDAREVTFVFYFSGHGDAQALHLQGETLPVPELSAKIARIPARLRVVVLDACRTTELLRAKGMSVEAGFTVQAPAQPPASGSVWVYASADGQAAQESDEIGGALFTHFWIAGLRGAADVNNDRRVTLDESFNYAHSQTLLRSARAGGVLQRPEARLDLTAAGPLVLTEIAVDRAQIEFPRDNNSLYLVYAVGARSVVAEIYGAPDHATRVALPPGRYIIQQRAGVNGAAAEISLAPSSLRVLSPSDFHAFPGEKLAQKGELLVRPWSIGVRESLYTGHSVTLGDELALSLEHRAGAWSIGLSPFGGYAVYRSEFNHVREGSAGGEVSLDYGFALTEGVRLRLGVDARAQIVAQTVERTDAARLAPAGFTSHQNYEAAVAGGGVHSALRIPVNQLGFIDMGLRGLLLGMDTDEGLRGRLMLGVTIGGGIVF
jgi:hypothetical protein